MFRRLVCTGLIAVAVVATPAVAQKGPQQGRIKKVDAAKGTIEITTGDRDVTAEVTDDAKILGLDNKELTKRLEASELKPGTAVMYFVKNSDGKVVLLGLKLLAPGAAALGDSAKPPPAGSGEIRQGKLKKIDLDKMMVIVTDGDKDREALLTDSTQVFDALGATIKEKLAGFKEGADVMFKISQKDGKDVLIGIKLGSLGAPPPDLPKVDTSSFKPLTDMGKTEYQGFPGGLYPDGKNERPDAHEAAGLALAKQIQPLDSDGKPDPSGKIVILSIGMSNTSQASGGFAKHLAEQKDEINPSVLFVNGAVGGMTAAAIQDPLSPSGTKYWAEVDNRLKMAKVTRAQVQAIWIKEADAGPASGFPKYAKTLQAELTRIVQLLPDRFPNVRLVYLSSRTYGGYATTKLNPEPYAYESGFAVRWLIEEQIKGSGELNFDSKKGEVRAPWLSWGPYLWANGTIKRADGFWYDATDFAKDGTHHSEAGQDKIGGQLLQFFRTDTTTRTWFLRAKSG